MIRLLAKWFITDKDNASSLAVRKKYGLLCGGMGIFLNVVLFGVKLFAGSVSASVSIIADALNNLSDAGSSIVTLIGFKLAGQKADMHHPFGHGRYEYISALIISMIIMVMGFELAKTSVERILLPQPVEYSAATLIILCASILVKLYMFAYNRQIGKKVDSGAMRATAFDSLCDSAATIVVLISALVSHFTGMNIDGWCGIAVALFILYAGISSMRDTVNSLLGKPADPALVKSIEEIIRSYPEVTGIHDLIVHDYGPGRGMISLHAEVSEEGDIRRSHDTIDNIERRLKRETGYTTVIHMDPIAGEDEVTQQLKEKVTDIVRALDHRLSIHDFRVVIGTTHTNLIFDLVIPFDKRISGRETKAKVEQRIRQLGEEYYAVITVDRSFI